jgi:hypothetical protein
MRMLFNQAIEITKDEAINHSRKEYNPREWKRIVERFSERFDDAKFYDLGMGNYNQDEVGVVYITNGVRYFMTLSYSSCLSSYDGVGQINLYDDGVSMTKFRDDNGNVGYLPSRNPVTANFLRVMTSRDANFIVAKP